MRNIHILPTEKPSELYINMQGILSKSNSLLLRLKSRHIYITSDEEIKEGVDFKDKWVISEYGFIVKADRIENNYLIHSNGGSNFLHYYKFIILTTDQDLIKDGVQAIDDEFLEWFCKNSSCERVEVSYEPKNFLDTKQGWEYEIIIPKKEPKQENDYTALLQPVGTKQETLEEVAERIRKELVYAPVGIIPNFNDGFELGAKWQQEQDKKLYSEEEVLGLLLSRPGPYLTDEEIKEWFNKFKKK
jgi:hypothetical protein